MIISHDFGISLEEYAINGKKNKFPTFDKCPNCNCVASGNLHRHGYYWRNVITEEEEVKIPICRIICLSCKKTFFIIPDFLIPYFQHSLETIFKRIEQFLEKKKSKGSRQLLAFYWRRYQKKLRWIHSFFVDLGEEMGLSKDMKKEAIKYMKMIRDFGESLFLRRSWGAFILLLYGKLILPYFWG
ncbi:DUF6431 domain-containing protein [Caldifermentibacillus hisashii]|uniref:DUF6431 domain-containing protein n=1 Tax=Caldifermentibacillus hisashii TaxID=996558 RepID=UPI002E0416E9|nr:DUF6431 domain-containing protein [Caldifermentibacillus hisashii]